jgi:Lrp/AsnC family transcriptional regulator for asnA, asnC and gidA
MQPKTMKKNEIDETNLAIIKELRQGRKPFKQIADRLGVTENTVRSRVNKMTESGLLEITGQVDFEQISKHQTVIIGVKLKTTDLFQKGEEFSRLKGVVSVSIVTGRYDLMIMVEFNEEYGLKEFYTQEVATISEVQSLETFVVYKSYNLKMPYIL